MAGGMALLVLLLLQVLLLLPPIVAWLYAVILAVFLPSFRECTGWTELLPTLPSRTSLLTVAVAIEIALLRTRSNDLVKSNNPRETILPLAGTAVAAVITTVLSLYFIRQSRVETVEGGPPPLAVIDAVHGRDTVIVITGANTGIGFQTALQLAQAAAATSAAATKGKTAPGDTVIVLACRSLTKAESARQKILKSLSVVHHNNDNDTTAVVSSEPTSSPLKPSKSAATKPQLSPPKLMETQTSSFLQEQEENTNQQTAGNNEGKKRKRPIIELLDLDLSSLASVRKAAAELQERFKHIDILINNAGIMMAQQQFTNDGYEMVMQANYLGHYLFTRLLLPSMMTTMQNEKGDDDAKRKPRILNLTSSTYKYADSMDVEDLFCQTGGRAYSLFGQYAQSKLANILFTNELAARYGKSISCHSIHPGIVRTDVVRNMPWYLYYPDVYLGAMIVSAFQKTPAQGAWNTVYVATAPLEELQQQQRDHDDPAPYWTNRRIQEKLPAARDVVKQRALWALSAQLVGLEDDDCTDKKKVDALLQQQDSATLDGFEVISKPD